MYANVRNRICIKGISRHVKIDISGNAKMTGTDMSEMPGNDTEDNKTEIR